LSSMVGSKNFLLVRRSPLEASPNFFRRIRSLVDLWSLLKVWKVFWLIISSLSFLRFRMLPLSSRRRPYSSQKTALGRSSCFGGTTGG
jgi:hypothetical protein